MSKRTKRNRVSDTKKHSTPDAQQASNKLADRPPARPPQRNRPMLAASLSLLAIWIVFLLYVAIFA